MRPVMYTRATALPSTGLNRGARRRDQKTWFFFSYIFLGGLLPHQYGSQVIDDLALPSSRFLLYKPVLLARSNKNKNIMKVCQKRIYY